VGEDREELSMLHAALLLGAPVALPPGTLLERRIIGGIKVRCRVARRSHTTDYWRGRVRVLCRFDHANGHDCVWIPANEVERIVSLPGGTNVEDLLCGT
jgi:hypothetical protein